MPKHQIVALADIRRFPGSRKHPHFNQEKFANDLMKPIHDRMPVIIPKDRYDLWLDPRRQDMEKLMKLLGPYSANEMMAYRISKLVNNPRNNVEKCIEAVG